MNENRLAACEEGLEALLEEARLLLQSGLAHEAERACQKILARDPKSLPALLLAATAARRAGELETAIRHLRAAAATAPDSSEIHFHLGNVLHQSSRIPDAMQEFRRALDLAPELAPARINLGGLLLSQGQPSAALPLLREAVRLAPRQSFAWGNLAATLLMLGDVAEAAEAARRATEIDPSNAEAHVVLGNALQWQGLAEQSRGSFRAALGMDPGNRNALVGLGSLLRSADDLPEAIALARRAADIAPPDHGTLGLLAALLQQACDWDGLDRALERLDALDDDRFGAAPAEPALLNVSRLADPEANLRVARAWSDHIVRRVGPRPEWSLGPRRRNGRKKIRVGYLSGDFHDHATAHLMRGLFSAHDRERFEVYAYSYGPDDSSGYRQAIERGCDRFVDVRRLSHAEAATRIHQDQVDILIDLKGHTKHACLEICALRPAPVQATYLGFPGTTGADFIDYILTDRIVSPPEHARFYSESLVYLSGCYQVNDDRQPIADHPSSRREAGLPEKAIVFCSFNQTFKIDRPMFGCWMAILRRVPHACLWLLRGNPLATSNLRRAAAESGVDPHRLIFADKLAKPRHLARLRLADIALDTRMYNGHTTTSDALWAGVPVIALSGRHFASRVSQSLLTTIGLPRLVCRDLESYASLAVELAHSPDALQALKDEIESRRRSGRLFDTAAFAQKLEAAYREMWRVFCEGQAPRPLHVAG